MARRPLQAASMLTRWREICKKQCIAHEFKIGRLADHRRNLFLLRNNQINMLYILKELVQYRDNHPTNEYGTDYDMCEVDVSLIDYAICVLEQIEKGRPVEELL